MTTLVSLRGAKRSAFAPRNDGLRLRSSKRLAEEFRILQSISPWQFDGFCNADPHACDDVRLMGRGMQCDRRAIERQAAMHIGDAEGFRQLARTRAQRPLVMQSPS